MFVQGNARLQMRHNLFIAGPGTQESHALDITVVNRARELVNNIFVGEATAPLATCVSAREPMDLFANNNFDGCPTLWALDGTALTTIAAVNAIASPEFVEPPMITTGNVAVAVAFVDAGVDHHLAADADVVLRTGGRDERALVPSDAGGAPRTLPVSIGPFEAD